MKNAENQNIIISFFEKNIRQTTPTKNISVLEFLGWIKTGKFQSQIDSIRSETNKEKQQELKRKILPYVTLSGVFERRNDKEMISHSGLIQIDLDDVTDHLTEDFPDIEAYRKAIQKDKHTFACFLSPRATGLKVIFRIDPNSETHKSSYLGIESYFKTKYGLPIDPSCKDVSRPFFVSFDPEIFVNQDSKKFSPLLESPLSKQNKILSEPLQTPDSFPKSGQSQPGDNSKESQSGETEEIKPNYILSPDLYDSCFEGNIKGVNRKHFLAYSIGQRNSFLFSLASALKRYGLPEEITTHKLTACYACSDFPESEIVLTIKSAYTNNPEEFGKYQWKISTKKEPEKKEAKTEKPDVENKPIITRIKHYLSQKYDFQLNTIKNKLLIKLKREKEFTEFNENNIWVELQEHGFKIGVSSIVSLLQSDFVPKHNPVESYFKNLPVWDKKTDYIDIFSSYVKAADQNRFKVQFKKMLVRMVACSLGHGFNKQAFVLIGKQNDGKSSFCRFLCPSALKDYITDEYNPENKDGRISLARNFIINLDELSVLGKTDIDKIKKAFAVDKINDRLPYDKTESILPRIANFVGSTNKSEFLTDPTGSVRWLCFEIEEIDFAYSKHITIDLVYSQAYSLFLEGFEYKVTLEELEQNEKANQKYTVQTKEMTAILEYFESVTEKERTDETFWTSRRISMELEAFTKQRYNEVNIGRALATLKIEQKQRKCTGFDYKVKGYYLRSKFSPINSSYPHLTPDDNELQNKQLGSNII